MLGCATFKTFYFVSADLSREGRVECAAAATGIEYNHGIVCVDVLHCSVVLMECFILFLGEVNSTKDVTASPEEAYNPTP